MKHYDDIVDEKNIAASLTSRYRNDCTPEVSTYGGIRRELALGLTLLFDGIGVDFEVMILADLLGVGGCADCALDAIPPGVFGFVQSAVGGQQ